MKKILTFLFILILSPFFIWADAFNIDLGLSPYVISNGGAQNKYIEKNEIPWSYEYWETKSNYYEILNNKFSSGSFDSNIGTTTKPTIPGKYSRIFRFPTYTEDYVFKKASSDMSKSGFSYKGEFGFTKYTTTELDSNTICEITSLNFDDENYEIKINSTLLPLKAGSNFVLYQNQQIHKISNNPIEHLLKKYYYMKTEVRAELINNDTKVVVKTINLGSGNYNGQKYVLIKPDTNTFSLSLPKETDLNLDVGVYFWKITAEPIDLKCDFDKSGSLENDERTIETYSLGTFEIDPCKIERDNTDGGENYKYKVGSDKVQIEYKIDNVKKKINYKLDETEFLTSALIMSLMPDDYFVKKGLSGNQNIYYSIKVNSNECTNTAEDNFSYYFLDLNLDLGFEDGKRELQDTSPATKKVKIDDENNLYLDEVLELDDLNPMIVNGEVVEFKKEEVALIAHNFEDLNDNGEERLNRAIERLNTNEINQTITYNGGKTKYRINIKNVSGFNNEVIYLFRSQALAPTNFVFK